MFLFKTYLSPVFRVLIERGAIGLDFNLNRLQGKMKRCFFEANKK
jgi:hypothetical protein